MEINTFITFEKLLSEAQARKEVLDKEIAHLKKILDERLGAFDQQVMLGQDPDQLHEVMDLLQKKIDIRIKERDTWDSAISGADKTSLIFKASQDVLHEGADIINKELRRDWSKGITELEDAKVAYLRVCAKLGAIQRNAEGISEKLSSGLEGFLPASGVPHLTTGIDLEGLAGPIFLDNNVIKKAFLLGGK